MKCFRKFFLFCTFFKSVDQYSSVPAAVINSDSPLFRSFDPESPEERMHPLFFGFILDWVYMKSSRIHTLDQLADLKPFSRRSESFKYNHNGNFKCFTFSLKLSDFGFKLRHFFLVLFF